MHPATRAILPFFSYDHLPEPLRTVSRPFHDLAHAMTGSGTPEGVSLGGVRLDGPELTAGLRKLLEAKDCAVRAALDPAD